MYIEPIKSKFRIIGYSLIALSFTYFSLEPVFNQLMLGLLYDNAVFNQILPYLYSIFYLSLLAGAGLINYKYNDKVSMTIVAATIALGLPYPIQNIYNLNHSYGQSTYVFYDLFAIAILLSMTFSLVYERKIYKFVGLILLIEWFFFDYWIASSGQYIFLGLSGLLTDMVAVLMVIYCILEIILEKTFTKVAL